MTGKIAQWAGRLTGFSTPIFGVSWEPSNAERSVAQRLITYLQDRRVLYNPSYAETPHHCVQSVIEIRHQLTSLMSDLNGAGVLHDHLNAMRATCRRFLDRLKFEADDDYGGMQSPGHYKSWIFQDALGQLRGIFGVHLAAIAVRFELEVGLELEQICPASPDETNV
jgi:hypothetical protein